jgi:hypothetical protein
MNGAQTEVDLGFCPHFYRLIGGFASQDSNACG